MCLEGDQIVTRGMGENMVSSLLVLSNNCKDVWLVNLELEVISQGERFMLRLKADSELFCSTYGFHLFKCSGLGN